MNGDPLVFPATTGQMSRAAYATRVGTGLGYPGFEDTHHEMTSLLGTPARHADTLLYLSIKTPAHKQKLGANRCQ